MKTCVKRRTVAAILAVAVLGFGAACSRAVAQETQAAPSEYVQKVLKPVESLINKNTFEFTYIDVKAVDIDKTVENWKQLVTDLFAKIKEDKNLAEKLAEAKINLDEIRTAYFRQLDVSVAQAKLILTPLMITDLKEIYVLANSRTMAMSPVRIVATFGENGSPDDFLTILKEFVPGIVERFHIEKRDGMLILSPPSGGLDMDNPSDKARLQRMFDAVKPEANPAILAGLERVKGAPIQAVFAPDSSIRGLATMGLAMAPPPADKFGGKTLTDGIKWTAIGLDPVKQIFALTIQSASPEAAQKLYDTTVETIDTGLDSAMKYRVPDENAQESETRITALENVKDFLPKVKEDCLQLVVDREFLERRLAIIVNFAIPATVAAREAANRAQCENNIEQIILALHNYHDVNKCLPPVMIADEDGKPLHSWRVLLLPYIEEMSLYEQIRLDEPWDSEHNKQFHDRVPRVYQCPSSEGDMTGMTSYSVVVGKECLFDQPNAKKTFADVSDGLWDTYAVVERKTPVYWMDPTQEIPFEKACEGINVSEDGMGSEHAKGMSVGNFGGLAYSVSEMVDPAYLRARLTCADKDGVSHVPYQNEGALIGQPSANAR